MVCAYFEFDPVVLEVLICSICSRQIYWNMFGFTSYLRFVMWHIFSFYTISLPLFAKKKNATYPEKCPCWHVEMENFLIFCGGFMGCIEKNINELYVEIDLVEIDLANSLSSSLKCQWLMFMLGVDDVDIHWTF